MKTFLAMIGRTNDDWLGTGIADYTKRVGKYISFTTITVPGIKNGHAMPRGVLMEKEGELLLALFSDKDVVILLDEAGVQLTSREFALRVQKHMISGTRNLYFVIGGAFGFSDALKARADHTIGLSRMTFSHQMVRLIFVEQLYRAMTIINNEQYHHG